MANQWVQEDKEETEYFLLHASVATITKKEGIFSVNAFSVDHLNWTELGGKTVSIFRLESNSFIFWCYDNHRFNIGLDIVPNCT